MRVLINGRIVGEKEVWLWYKFVWFELVDELVDFGLGDVGWILYFGFGFFNVMGLKWGIVIDKVGVVCWLKLNFKVS